jgi:hypothetical protein
MGYFEESLAKLSPEGWSDEDKEGFSSYVTALFSRDNSILSSL